MAMKWSLCARALGFPKQLRKPLVLDFFQALVSIQDFQKMQSGHGVYKKVRVPNSWVRTGILSCRIVIVHVERAACQVVLYDVYSVDSFAACCVARKFLGLGVHYEGDMLSLCRHLLGNQEEVFAADFI